MAASDPTTPLHTTSEGSGEGGGPGELQRGSLFGRYVILDRVGRGGAGAVYAAFDGTLDRRVALKILHHGPAEHAATDGRSEPPGWSRLVREAKTLARLTHPNVVVVYDVGAENERTFIAMELVDGEDLSAWIEHHARTTPLARKIEMAIAAGRGLAAAHAAGIVHRDFKPANVLVGADGRVRVSDFGIARDRPETKAAVAIARASDRDEVDVTCVGHRIVGTPYYLAPEQHDGLDATEKSDIYAFCLTLYELVYASRPFAATSVLALAQAKIAGVPAPPSGAQAIPTWLSRVIARGLDPDPARRFGSMSELLATIERARRGRSRGVLAVAALAALIGGAGSVYAFGRPDTVPDPCDAVARHLEGAWTDVERARVRSAFAGLDVPLAVSTATRAEAALDDYAERWVAARRDACVATQAGDEPGTIIDRRLACLDRRRAHLATLAEVLGDADAEIVSRAAGMLAALPAIEPCSDTGRLSAEVPPPEDPEAARRVQAVRERLQRHLALSDAGRFDAASTELDSVADEIAALDHPPLTCERDLYTGVLHTRFGRYPEAREALERAHFGAEVAHHDDVAAAAAARLLVVIGTHLRQIDQALPWIPHAEAAARRADAPRHLVMALTAAGWTLDTAGRSHEARDELAKAVAIADAELPAGDMTRADAHTSYGGVLYTLGEYDDALAQHEIALAVIREIHGDAHPNTALTIGALGMAKLGMHDVPGALAAFEEELELLVQALGSEHSEVASAHAHVGAASYEAGDIARARASFERAYEITRGIFGDEHPDTLDALANVARIAIHEERWNEAVAMLELVVAGTERAVGREHMSHAHAVLSLADALRMQGDARRALELHQQIVPIYERQLGSEHQDLGGLWLQVAQDHLALGEAADALQPLARAQGIYDRVTTLPTQRAELDDAHARALAESDRSEARRRAEAALQGYEQGGDAWASSAQRMRELLTRLP